MTRKVTLKFKKNGRLVLLIVTVFTFGFASTAGWPGLVTMGLSIM